MKTVLLLLVLSPLGLAAVDARKQCPGVPANVAVAACYQACGTKPTYDLCIQTMQQGGIDLSPSHKEETTVYAILAARLTSTSYDKTMLTLTTQLQQNESISGPERDAYGNCLDDYVTAKNSINRVADVLLSNCFFKEIGGEYLSGMTSLENCRDRLLAPWMNKTLLYPMVMGDRGKVLLAYLLGKLLI